MPSEQDTSRPPRVLIVTASVGAGHNAAARAVREVLAARRPDWHIDVLDVLNLTPRLFRAYYAGGYKLAMTRLPRIYGLGFRLTNRPQGPRRGLLERLRLWWEGRFLRRFRRRLQDDPPDLIVHTHFLAPPQIARWVRQGRLNVRQVIVATDCLTHRFWYAEDMEHWFASAEPTVPLLRRWGVPSERITLSGMPVHPKCTAPLDRPKILRQWNLPADKHIVLLSGGTDFTCGPVVKIARRIAAACGDAHVVVLAGRNKKLLGRLARLPEAGRRIVGAAFTDRMHELVEAAALMITKPGGSTTAECVARGTPMLLMNPVPGHEADNARYYASTGAACIARGTRRIVRQTARLLADPAARQQMAAAARRIHRDAAATVADAVINLLSRPPSTPADSSPPTG